MTADDVRLSHPRERAPDDKPKRGILLRLIRGLAMYLLPVVVIVAGIAGAVHLIRTAPQAQRRTPENPAALVRVEMVRRVSANAVVQAQGTVMPSQEVLLQPRVSGEVTELSPKLVPGGRFKTGEFILQIDRQDYKLAVEKTKSQVAQAEYELKLEQGHQEIARREWELLDMKEQAGALDFELALRKPHLLKATAALEAAKAALREAELNLDRTTIRAPFNCVVRSENVDLGAQVAPQTQLAILVGTDQYWVRAAVPVDHLRWVLFPDEHGEGGSKAAIRQELGTGPQGEWCGMVVRLLSDLEPQGRMARVLISVPDPLNLNEMNKRSHPLLIDAYVSVDIEGREVNDVFALPRTALRQGRQVWIMNGRNELEIRDVDIVWGNRDTLLVRSGMQEGERLVVSDLPAPVAGMALALEEPPPDPMPRTAVISENVRTAHGAGNAGSAQ
ncbi:MAG TPA: efflux RND transporter periplasmic adaptor subunit [Phycisphaerae bacterium]|nr:efflux RND transporter periplasmic adaptor subunit [Phycisphaerae bacterium]